MKYKDLISDAIIEFPELIEGYNGVIGNSELALSMSNDLYEFHMQVCEQIMHNNSTPSVYQFYEDIVRNYFIKLVDEYCIDKTNDDVSLKITKMVELFEKMALSGDAEVENVLLIGIFEGIIDDREKLNTIFTLLKEKSRLLLCRLQDYHDVDFTNMTKGTEKAADGEGDGRLLQNSQTNNEKKAASTIG